MDDIDDFSQWTIIHEILPMDVLMDAFKVEVMPESRVDANGGVKCVPDANRRHGLKHYRIGEHQCVPWFPAPSITPPFLQTGSELDAAVDDDDIEMLPTDPAASIYPRTSPRYQGFRKNHSFPRFWTQVIQRLPKKARLCIFTLLYGEAGNRIMDRYALKRALYLVPRPFVARGAPLPTHPLLPRRRIKVAPSTALSTMHCSKEVLPMTARSFFSLMQPPILNSQNSADSPEGSKLHREL